MKENRLGGKTVRGLILSAVFVVMWVFTAMTPMFADDYFYVLHLYTETPLTSFAELLDSISYFRGMHNGRVIAHFFAQLFLLLPDFVFPIVNAAVCTLLFAMIGKYVHTENAGRNNLLLICAFALVWILLPTFAHCFLWLTGSCSYLWAITVIICFLHPFFRRFMDAGPAAENSLLRTILALVFAFVAGSYSENGSFSMLAVAFCFGALIWLRDKKMPRDLVLRFMVACGGFLYLMLAPTELGKKNAGDGDRLFPALEILGLPDIAVFVIAGLLVVAAAFLLLCYIKGYKIVFKGLFLLAALAMLALTILILPGKLSAGESLLEKVNLFFSQSSLSAVYVLGIYFCVLMLAAAADVDRNKLIAATVFGIGSAASLVVFLVAIYFPPRAVLVSTIYTTIANLLLLSGICDKKSDRILRAFAAVVIAVFAVALVAGFADVKSVYEQSLVRNELIAQTQSGGGESLLLEQYDSMGKYSTVWPEEKADYYPGMEAFYGIDSIIIEGAEEF